MKYLFPWNWTFAGVMKLLDSGMTGFKRLFKCVAILFLSFELLCRFVNCLYLWFDSPYETFTMTFFDALREIISLLASGYALKLGLRPSSVKDFDRRRFHNLGSLLATQLILVILLGDKISNPDEYDETRRTIITRLWNQCSSPLWAGSVVIFFLSLFESFYLDLFPSSSQDIEPDEFFKYCILGRKEKLKQFTSKHRNLISINEKYKGSTALHLAIEGNHLQIVQYILQTFAEELDFTVTNEDGLIPLDLAIKKKYFYITNAILSDKRAWIFAFRSSLILAVKTGQDKIARTISQIRCKVHMSLTLSKSEFNALPINNMYVIPENQRY